MASTTPEANVIDLFGNGTSGEFSALGVLTLSGSVITHWWDIARSIFLWMCLSYALVFIGGALVALFFMRKHPYVILWVVPMLVMCVVGPCTIGFITSSSLAFALSSADKFVSPWHSMVLGVSQSILVMMISFSRLLGTL